MVFATRHIDDSALCLRCMRAEEDVRLRCMRAEEDVLHAIRRCPLENDFWKFLYYNPEKHEGLKVSVDCQRRFIDTYHLDYSTVTHLTDQIPRPTIRRWCPPSPGLVKINLDGSFSFRSGRWWLIIMKKLQIHELGKHLREEVPQHLLVLLESEKAI
ncbi:hypothetical protein GOBAR_AA30783 [Gossypium barbadense]|uniref:Uncharacterized protein n=1 Tax=Gossypium barbadense TaxID=3634 RepID=A0A2P5WFR4_GOSBA|nr:hypothetical protein GOBAR_AA30783 [Gossypium barbadense]